MADDDQHDDDQDRPGDSARGRGPDPDGLGDAGKRALDSERKARRDAEKKLADVQKRLDELADRDKTDQQKLTDRLTAAEADLAKERSSGARLRVAMRKGLTETQARRLVGESEEELEADADELLETFGGRRPPGRDDQDDDRDPNPRRGRPQEQLRGGVGGGDDDPVETNPQKLAALIPRR